MSNKVGDALADIGGESIYAIRWVLLPMYAGLWFAIMGYLVHYFSEIFHFVFDFHSGFPFIRENASNGYLIFTLELVDMTMIANLIVMTTIGGYSTFVKEFASNQLTNRPRWMNKLDSSTLKIKMAMSLAGVSAVHLLKTFIDIGDSPNPNYMMVGVQVGIHIVFLVSMLAFSLNAKLLHGHEPSPPPVDDDQREVTHNHH